VAVRSNVVASTISRRAAPALTAQIRASLQTAPRLDRYVDREGRLREVVVLPGAVGSTLIVDRDAAAGSDLRLVAHLARDEPAENGALVCAGYLDQVRLRGCRCRPLAADDFRTAPFERSHEPADTDDGAAAAEPVDREGATYRLHEHVSRKAARELRWYRHDPLPAAEPATVSVRDAIAALESY
jgi:hypothetical protein